MSLFTDVGTDLKNDIISATRQRQTGNNGEKPLSLVWPNNEVKLLLDVKLDDKLTNFQEKID